MGWSRKTVSGLKAKFSGLKYLAFSPTIGDEGRVEEEERTPRLLLGWRVSLKFRDYVRV